MGVTMDDLALLKAKAELLCDFGWSVELGTHGRWFVHRFDNAERHMWLAAENSIGSAYFNSEREAYEVLVDCMSNPDSKYKWRYLRG
jgi:hypothetical protein